MISKKITILLCIGIASASYCMEDNKDLVAIQKEQRHFSKQFKRLISLKGEKAIIDHLKSNQTFTKNDLTNILKDVSKAKLEQVIDYLVKNYEEELDLQDRINSLILRGKIEEIKELTNFNNFLTNGKLSVKEYFANLTEEFGLSVDIMDEIFLHDKINYELSDGSRLLQLLIADYENYEQSVAGILNFIESAPVGELEAQDDQLNTALYMAGTTHQEIKNNHQVNALPALKKIIKRLLKKGANPEIPNRKNSKFTDSKFYTPYYPDSCKKWQAAHKLVELFKDKDQKKIKHFLAEDHDFGPRKQRQILYEAFKADLSKVIKFAFNHYNLTEADLLKYAYAKKDIDTIKKLIKFDTFFDNNRILNITDLFNKFWEFNCSPETADEIIAHGKINYQDNEGGRFLHRLLHSGNFDLAVRFIESAPREELDAKDKDENTALHVASIGWENSLWSDGSTSDRSKGFKRVIKKLVRYGANIDITNHDHLALSSSEFYKANKKCVKKCQQRYQEAIQIRKGEKKRSYFGAKTKIALAAISALGIGALIYYFGNQYLNKNVKNVKLK